MKKIISFITVLSIILSAFSLCITSNAQSTYDFLTESNENFGNYIPSEAHNAVFYYYPGFIDYAKDCAETFELTDSDFINTSLGEPFYIYTADRDKQTEIYYYPIMNSESEFILTITAINTNHGWKLSLNNELAKELNDINYFNEDYVFYQIEDSIFAESNNSSNIIKGDNPKDNPFESLSYNDKREEIIDSINNSEQLNIEEQTSNIDENSLEAYTPSFEKEVNTDSTKEKLLKLYNAKGQGNNNICWAASVSTIVNYLKGTNITPEQVCKDMNIYKEASIIQKQTALKKYGITYSQLRDSVLTWQQIILNIDNKKPVAMSAFGKDAKGNVVGHAVTLTGYRNYKDINLFIMIWDSAANSGNGATTLVVYYPYSTTTFKSSGIEFTWKFSLSSL